jgi:hypothetical protein
MPLVRGHCPIASIGCQIALTKIVQGWMGSKTDGCLHACMHARPPARLGRAPPPRRPAVCMSSDGRVSNTRAAAAPSSPTPTDALSPHRTSPSESGRCARTMDCTDNDDVPTDNDERSAALCPCMPTAPSRDRSIERSSRLSVNQST